MTEVQRYCLMSVLLVLFGLYRFRLWPPESIVDWSWLVIQLSIGVYAGVLFLREERNKRNGDY